MESSLSIEDIELNQYKWLTHIEKLEKLSRNEDIYPVTVELDLVDYCNHNCWWCVDPKHMKNYLEKDFVDTLLLELKSMGIKGIVFKGGGEPTLHKDFEEILSLAKKIGFEVGIVTNGSNLLKYAQAIVENADYIRISIDGPTSESHKKLHQSNDFNEIIKGVEVLSNLREEKKKRHPIIGISFAMDYESIDLVNDAINLGDRLKVDYILLRPPFFEEVGRKNTMTIEQKKELIQVFEKEKSSYLKKMRIFIDYWVSDSEAKEFFTMNESPRRGKYTKQGENGIEHITKTCLASPLLAVITAEKKVYPCCNLRFIEEWCIGTIDYDKDMTFKNILESAKRKVVLERIHRIECIKFCTHPMSKYNEIISYLKSPKYHSGFV